MIFCSEEKILYLVGVFLGQRVQGQEGRMKSREADVVGTQSLKGDQIPAEEIEFQKLRAGV